MEIDGKLNLVVPIGADSKGNADRYFHSMPIHKDVFRRYHFAIAKTFNVLFANDMQISGPQIAAMTLEDVSIDLGAWEDKKDDKGKVIRVGVQSGLIGEIRRLTNTLVFTDGGWITMQVDDALNRDLISADEWDEALQRIVFFTLASVMLPTGASRDLILMACEIWQMQATSLTCSAFAASLPVSIPEETGSKPAKASPAIC
jgi:hypothetical protein